MKIVPYIRRQAPELCYFTVNGHHYRKGFVNSVDWYKLMTDPKAPHPITAIRRAHFAPAYFAKVVTVTVTYPQGYEYVNSKRSCVFTDYRSMLAMVRAYLKEECPSYVGKVTLWSGELMPKPEVKITTSTRYVRAASAAK